MVVLKVIAWNSSNFNIISCNSSGSNKIDSNFGRKIVMTVAIIEEGKNYHNSIWNSKSSSKIS